MLNIKVRKMEEKNIFFKVDSKIEKIPMKDIDFVVLLGNLLDNAIEAAEKCEDGKGKITCIFRNINDMFIFKVKNTSIYKPYEKNTKFYTSKKEKDEHGWGIESVKQIVRKYNGEIDFKYDKDFFEVETINEQISNFAQTYPTNLKASSNEALLFMRRYRFANCSCFSCCFKDAYPSSNVQ